MIEACLQYRRQRSEPGRFWFDENITSIESDLKELLGRDGVHKYEGAAANAQHVNLKVIKARMGPPPWVHVLVRTETDQTAMICQKPGEGARRHYHVTHDEWWVILEGTFEWRLDDGTIITARESDVVFMPRGTVHSIVCVNEQPGIRLACGARSMEHIYVR